MSDPKTEWMRKLKATDPLRKKTFTPEKMEAIAMKIVDNKNRSPRNKQRSRVAAYVAGAVVAAVLIIGFLPSGSYTGWLLNMLGSDSEKHTAPPVSTAPPIATEQPMPEPPKETAPPAETAPLTGKLREHLPFNTESEMTISIHDNQSGKDYEIPADRKYVILQSMNWVDLEAAKAPKAESPASVLLRFTVGDQTYEIPYWLESNTVEWQGQSFYMNDRTLLLAYGLLQPESQLGIIDQRFEQARLEQENEQMSRRSYVYESDRLEVNGKDYDGWEKELAQLTPVSKHKFYDTGTEKMDSVRQYESGIVTLSLTLVFEDSAFQTKDKIRVGLTDTEVLEALGKPNHKSASQWSYTIGDFSRFHLYFQDGKVAFVVMTTPL
ncbi:hypothetical protein [Paenibacillus sp. NPDC058071]|uniref:hypothetical protein n=1 Tax=Paenibacillus sp. NPDC058071 TaxID=3346326 RepID=UPI0036DE3F3A